MEIKINDHLVYLEYEKDSLMFEALENYLNQGFKFKDNIFLAVVITDGKMDYILSYLHVDPTKDIISQLKAHKTEKELMLPDYKDTILNDISGIRANYGYSYNYEFDKEVFNKKYKNCIVMLLDGLGKNVLEYHLDENSFLRRHLYKCRHAIYPSTTAASTTATMSGITPLESGWTGWSNYIKEMNKEIILFTGVDYYSEEPTGRSGFDFIPVKPFFHDMDIHSTINMPDFAKPVLKDILKNSLKNLEKNKDNIEYVYYTEPDSLMHEFGTYHEKVTEEIRRIDKEVEEFANQLDKDTLLIISADHGHTPVKVIDLYQCEPINKHLRTKPSNDSRCTVFRLKEGHEKNFVETFNYLFKDVYTLMKTEDAIALGYFGNPNLKRNERIADFLGDYIAFGINEYYFNYCGGKDFVFKSHHAGITKDEMEVPVIIVRK